MKALEEKVLAQVEKSLVPMRHDIQQIKQKSETSSWMFRNIVAEQKDRRAECRSIRISLGCDCSTRRVVSRGI